jgi:hypothetical protein
MRPVPISLPWLEGPQLLLFKRAYQVLFKRAYPLLLGTFRHQLVDSRLSLVDCERSAEELLF